MAEKTSPKQAGAPAKKPLRLGHGGVQRSAPSEVVMERVRTNGVYLTRDDIGTIGTFVPSNDGYIDLPTGAYTYRQLVLSLVAPSAIAGKTSTIDGLEYVNADKMGDFITDIAIEINGRERFRMTAEEIRLFNNYLRLPTINCAIRLLFGGAVLFDDDAAADAYQLGTANVKSLRLRIRTTGLWPNGMRPVLSAEYADVPRNITYFQTVTRTEMSAPAAGNFPIMDVGSGLQWSAMWIKGAGIKRARLTIDRNIVADMGAYHYRALGDTYGRSGYALGDGIIWDTFRDGEGIGVDSVANSVAERNRNAQVRWDLEMAAPAPVSVIVIHCGLFRDQ